MFSLGCASNNEGQLEGTKWVSQKASINGNECPQGALKLEFQEDGKLIYQVKTKVYEGTYVLGSGNYVTFKLNEKVADRLTHLEQVKIEDSTLTLIDSDGAKVRFDKN